MAMGCWPSRSERPGIPVERGSPRPRESSRPVVAHAGHCTAATDERGLAAAVRPDQPIAIPAAELHGRIREKALAPELHGDTGGDDHLGSGNKKSWPRPAWIGTNCEGRL